MPRSPSARAVAILVALAALVAALPALARGATSFEVLKRNSRVDVTVNAFHDCISDTVTNSDSATFDGAGAFSPTRVVASGNPCEIASPATARASATATHDVQVPAGGLNLRFTGTLEVAADPRGTPMPTRTSADASSQMSVEVRVTGDPVSVRCGLSGAPPLDPFEQLEVTIRQAPFVVNLARLTPPDAERTVLLQPSAAAYQFLFQARAVAGGSGSPPQRTQAFSIECRTLGQVCGETAVPLGNATLTGQVAETAQGSRIFRTQVGQEAWVGGFRLKPRAPNGALVANANAGTLAEEGAGVDVLLGDTVLPLPVDRLPVRLARSTVTLNQEGTLARLLVSLPLGGKLEVGWDDGGKSSSLALDVDVEKLGRTIGPVKVGDEAAVKLAARTTNCTGLELSRFEASAREVSFTPRRLLGGAKISLVDMLLRYERTNNRDQFTGQAGVRFPVGKGQLTLTGRGSILDGELASVGVRVDGFNRPIPDTPLFFQSVEGDVTLRPEWGVNLGVGASLGPRVQNVSLIEGALNMRLQSQAGTACPTGTDPLGFVGTAKMPVIERFQAGKVMIELDACLYFGSDALEARGRVEAVLGELGPSRERPGETEVVAPVLKAEAQASGFVGIGALGIEGAGRVVIPLVGELGGRLVLSTRAVAGCAQISFFAGGAAYVWGEGRAQAFTGCDLGPFRPVARSGNELFPGLREAALGSPARVTVTVDEGLPFAAFSARGASAPPRVRLTGPGGQVITSSATLKAVIGRDVVIVPVPAEDRTFVFVRRPRAGAWTVEGLSGPLREVRSAEGLPRPRVTATVRGTGARRTLRYRVVRLPGQSVQFQQRAADGTAVPIGRPTLRAAGLIAFTAVSPRAGRVEALVTQDGLPRTTVRVATLAPLVAAAPGLPTPARLAARRLSGSGLRVSWGKVPGATRYRVEVLVGTRVVARRTLTATTLTVRSAPRNALRVRVRALGAKGMTGPPASAAVAPAPAQRAKG